MPAEVPEKVTLLLNWVAPKLLPAMVTDVPAGPVVGDRLVMLGAIWAWSPAVPITKINNAKTALRKMPLRSRVGRTVCAVFAG
jgi:hypothetical protein